MDPILCAPDDIPEIRGIMDDNNMGNWDAPSVLMFITQGTGDFLEGTSPHRSLGAGDGIMITEYVRTHSRQYCTANTQIEYRRHPYLSHILAAVPWLVEGYYRLEGCQAPGFVEGRLSVDQAATACLSSS